MVSLSLSLARALARALSFWLLRPFSRAHALTHAYSNTGAVPGVNGSAAKRLPLLPRLQSDSAVACIELLLGPQLRPADQLPRDGLLLAAARLPIAAAGQLHHHEVGVTLHTEMTEPERQRDRGRVSETETETERERQRQKQRDRGATSHPEMRDLYAGATGQNLRGHQLPSADGLSLSLSLSLSRARARARARALLYTCILDTRAAAWVRPPQRRWKRLTHSLDPVPIRPLQIASVCVRALARARCVRACYTFVGRRYS